MCSIRVDAFGPTFQLVIQGPPRGGSVRGPQILPLVTSPTSSSVLLGRSSYRGTVFARSSVQFRDFSSSPDFVEGGSSKLPIFNLFPPSPRSALASNLPSPSISSAVFLRLLHKVSSGCPSQFHDPGLLSPISRTLSRNLFSPLPLFFPADLRRGFSKSGVPTDRGLEESWPSVTFKALRANKNERP